MRTPAFAASKGLALAGMFVLLCGFTEQPLPRNLQFDHADSPIWSLLKSETRFAVDKDKGVMVAAFDDGLRKAEGRSFRIDGYILPLDAGTMLRHFVVMRRSPGCPFCPPNGVGEAVEVFLKTPLRYTPAEVTVTGRLKLQASSADGLFYQLQEAKAS